MSVTVHNVPPHSPSSVRPKLPVGPPNSLNGTHCKSCSSSPRQLRLNVPSVLPSQDLSLSLPISNVVSGRSNLGFADVRRKTAVIGQRKRISTPHQMAPSRQIYMEVGLENLGNTCFMNSSLQCLLHIEPLVSYFLGIDIDKVLNEASPMKGLLAASFAQLVKDIFNASAGSSIAPMAFQKVIGHHAPHLLDNQQQDCQEFLRFLLDGMSEDLCRRKKDERRDQMDTDNNQSPKYSKTSMSSRTREKVKAGRSLAGLDYSTAQASPETKNFDELGDIEIQNNMFEKTASLGNFKMEKPQGWNDKNRVLENGKHDDSIDDVYSRKFSSAARLREQVGLASMNNSPSNRMLQINDRLERLSLEDPGSSRTSPADRIRQRTGSTLSSKSNAELFPEWFPSRDNDNLKVDAVQLCQDESSGIFADCSLLKPCCDLDLKGDLPALLDAEGSGARTPNGNRMRFKLPNLLPISFARDKGEKASKASSRVESPVVPSTLQSIDQLSPHRVHSPMTITSRGTKKSPLSTGSSLSGTRVSELSKIKSVDSADKSSCWDSSTPEKDAIFESKKAWQSYLNLNDSVVTDIFAGQLQSTIECLTCKSRSFCFDPFLDLSVPVPKRHDGKSKWRRQFSLRELSRCPLEECIEKFTGEEILDGENMYTCLKCNEKRKCTKKLSIFKYPRVLVIHIKRFRYSEISREKISTDVIFPLKGLDLGPYLSSDRAPLERGGAPSSDQNNEALNGSIRNDICCNSKFSEQSSPVDSRILGPNSSIFDQNSDPADSTMPQTPVPSETHTDAPFDSDQYPPIYDLTGVSHHCGTLSGGHYVAHVDTNPATKSSSDHHNTADQSVDSTFRAELNSGSDSQDRCARDASSGGQGEDARWMCFNDEQVSAASPVDIIGPTAYVLFYRLREY